MHLPSLDSRGHRASRITAIAGCLVIVLAGCGASVQPAPSISIHAADPATPPASLPSDAPPAGTVPNASADPLPTPTGQPTMRVHPGLFPGGLLIADRGNGRLLVVTSADRILWRFPVKGSLPNGQQFEADDAFISPDGKTIVANDDNHHVVDRIDIASRRVVWQYGHYGVPSARPGFLDGPDDSYPLANGNVIVSDIRNCRVIEVDHAKRIVRQWGRTGVCADQAPITYGDPNGDTPLPDGGLLITEIRGSRVVRLSASGKVVFDIHVPVAYPSDAHLDRNGNVVVADYSAIGAVVAVTPTGRLLWRYDPASGGGRLDHPSLAVPLPDGMILINDDFRERVVLLDPRTRKIVWQYGITDQAGLGPDHLHIPDGVDVAPVGLF
jgi:sugar lactone lactonase YvrE